MHGASKEITSEESGTKDSLGEVKRQMWLFW